MADPSLLATQRKQAFELVAQIVRDWRQAGRKTTSAGVKSAMMADPGGFDEKALGYADFADFLNAAHSESYIDKFRQSSGHWMITLPGESLAGAAGDLSPLLASRSGATLRIRPEVWGAVVDWRVQHRRLWDTQEQRAFYYPVDGDGRPAWEGEPSRFHELAAVTQEQQIAWMRSFAEGFPAPQRDLLSAALTSGSPVGAFRRALEKLTLQSRWRDELHKRVNAHVMQWAEANSVPAAALTVKPLPARAAGDGLAQGGRGPQPNTTSRFAEPRPLRPSSPDYARGGDAAAELRTRLHLIIDRMPLDELASLPVRAEYLLSD